MDNRASFPDDSIQKSVLDNWANTSVFLSLILFIIFHVRVDNWLIVKGCGKGCGFPHCHVLLPFVCLLLSVLLFSVVQGRPFIFYSVIV